MVQILRLFINTIKEFSRNNRWVFVVYLALILIIFKTNKSDLANVILISTCHFISDIFIMMMLRAYSRGEYVIGSYCQILSFLIFLSLKLDAGIRGEWHYLAADPIYLLAAIKNYNLDTRGKNITLINPLNMSILSLLIVATVLYSNFNIREIWTTSGEIIQSSGIFLFAIGLTITRKEYIRSMVSIAALSMMVIGSSIEFYRSITQDNNSVNGLELSYIILPITVLIFLIKTVYNQTNSHGTRK